MDTLLNAIKQQGYRAFSALGNEQFKIANPKQQFDKFSRNASRLLQSGYQQHYLGSLARKNVDVYIYKLSCDNATSDSLAMTDSNNAGELSSTPVPLAGPRLSIPGYRSRLPILS